MTSANRRLHLPAPLIAAVAFLALALPVILLGLEARRASGDQTKYHLPTIRAFETQLPTPDLSDYGSATTPGYHLLMAAASGAFGGLPDTALRIISALFTCALVALLAGALSRRLPPALALAMTLPAAVSLYVYSSGAWLLPDNLAWLLVLAALLLALAGPRCPWRIALAGAVLLALVLVRQIHIWAAAPLLVGAVLADAEPSLLRPTPDRLRRALLTAAACVPAGAALLYFLNLWGGLVPPTFARQHAGEGADAGLFNAAVPAMAMASLAVVAPFFIACFPRTLSDLRALRRTALLTALAGGAIALLVALVPETSYARDAGRWGGLWNLARLTPSIGDRSPAILALAALGGASLALALRELPARPRAVMGAAAAAFIAAHCANEMAWQRYYEPFWLLTIPLCAAIAPRAAAPDRRAALGPLLLALGLGGVTAAAIVA